MATYAEFLDRKAQLDGGDGFTPADLPEFLFGFQADLTEWAVRMGRAALFADCGLGKTPMQLAWADQIHRHTGKPVLVVTPLAVSFQTDTEAAKFGIDAAISRDGTIPAPVTITNYERLEQFTPDRFGGVVCDESSAIKAFDGVRRAIVTEFCRTLRYRLLATATAAPNDYVELGTSSEALGYLGHMDMLNRFFVNQNHTSAQFKGMYRGKGNREKWVERNAWRFKGHAEEPFWRWVASWARAMRKPSDLGHPDDGFNLPPLTVRRYTVEAVTVREGQLFDLPAQGLHEERDEQRRTIQERCELAADLLADVKTGIAWCHLNDEGNLLERLIPGSVQVAGADPPEAKEEKFLAFLQGDARVLVCKPKIGAWGLNLQHCHRLTYFPSHSYEQWYQAVRRCWRFGQTQPVTVDAITTPGGENVLKNLERKAAAADAMFDALVAHMRQAVSIRRGTDYPNPVEVPGWATS